MTPRHCHATAETVGRTGMGQVPDRSCTADPLAQSRRVKPRRHRQRMLPGPLLLAGALALLSAAVLATPTDYSLPMNKGMVIKLPANTQDIAIGTGEIAEVRLLDPNHLYVMGNKLGTTTVVLCGVNRHHEKDCFRTLKLEVTHDLEALKAKLHEIFPDESPRVYSSQNAIVLAGQVSSVDKMNAMLAIAGTFANPDMPGGQGQMGAGGMGGGGGGAGGVRVMQYDMNPRVINLMQVGGPQQVMLGVTVAEMTTSLARRLKVDFSAFGGGDIKGGAISGPDFIEALINNLPLEQAAASYNPAALFLRFAGSDATVRTFINAARDNGLAKVLAEPNLTTISGQDAEFQSGGSFPVPVAQFGAAGGAGGGISVQFFNYGVILKFLPVVLDSGRISLKVNVMVSELSNQDTVTVPAGATGQSFTIPSLIQRSASSSLELDSGQTLGIAGLIQDRTRELITKFPGLGDLPVLGQLFTSQEYNRSETELMIFVTPQLAKPVNPDRIRLPTDNFAEPSDLEFYGMGRTEARKPLATRPRSLQNNMGGLRGHFGPTIQENKEQ